MAIEITVKCRTCGVTISTVGSSGEGFKAVEERLTEIHDEISPFCIKFDPFGQKTRKLDNKDKE